MNGTYNIERRNFRTDGSNCRPIKIVREEENSALDAVGEIIAKFASGRVALVIRAIIAVVGLIAFIGIIGGMENGAISIFGGCAASAAIFAVQLIAAFFGK